MTKLLNPKFRKFILQTYKFDNYGINQYAKYVCDTQILQRLTGYENDSKSSWGFPPLNILCCFRNDGSFDKRFFEFNTVNHFLKDYDGESAVEVVKCMLILWLQAEKKSIHDFNYEKIDAELVKIDKQIAEQQEKDRKIDETGGKIKNIVEPILNECAGRHYNDIAGSVKTKIEKILDHFKDARNITTYVVSLDRNTKDTIDQNELFIDIGYKIDNDSQFTILACHTKLEPGKFEDINVSDEKISS